MGVFHPAYHDARDRSQILQRAIRRLERLGYRVTVQHPPEPGTDTV